MPSRTRITAAASAAACLLLLCSLGASAAHAGYNEGDDCDTKGTRILAGAGGDSGTIMTVRECNDNGKWEAQATYHADPEHQIIFEPRNAKLDYTTYSSIDPFAGLGYIYSKARELYPTADGWPAVTQYATQALTAKPRAIATRNNLDPKTACPIYPERYSRDALKKHEGWLPPTSTPDGKTGFITYDLDPTLSVQQKTTIIAGLIAYEITRAGSALPTMQLWKPGTATPPTIHFQPGDWFPETHNGQAEGVHWKIGPDGIVQWVDGNINVDSISPTFTPRTVLHEILHVEGFDHIPLSQRGAQVMSEEPDEDAISPWLVDLDWNADGPVRPYPDTTDRCTTYGVSLAK